MQGLHLTADLYDCRCDAALLIDAAHLAATCRDLVRRAGLVAVDESWHRFPPGGREPADGGPGGVTGVVLLAESHFAVHTWPERRAVTLDVFVCNLTQDNSARAEQLMAAAFTEFEPARWATHRLQRGDLAVAASTDPG